MKDNREEGDCNVEYVTHYSFTGTSWCVLMYWSKSSSVHVTPPGEGVLRCLNRFIIICLS